MRIKFSDEEWVSMVWLLRTILKDNNFLERLLPRQRVAVAKLRRKFESAARYSAVGRRKYRMMRDSLNE